MSAAADPLVRLLGAAGAALVAVLVWELASPPEPPADRPPPPQAAVAAEEETTGTRPPVDYAAVLQRPLFHPDRRPPDHLDDDPGDEPPEDEPDDGETAAPPPHGPAWRVVGMARTPDAAAILVHDIAAKLYLRLREGDSASGWTIAAIGPDHVVLDGAEGQRFRLPIGEPGGGGAAADGEDDEDRENIEDGE